MPSLPKHQQCCGRWQLRGSTQSSSSVKDAVGGHRGFFHGARSCSSSRPSKGRPRHQYGEIWGANGKAFSKKFYSKQNRRHVRWLIAGLLSQHYEDIKQDDIDQIMIDCSYYEFFDDEYYFDWDRYCEPMEEPEPEYDYCDDYDYWKSDYDDHYDRDYGYL